MPVVTGEADTGRVVVGPAPTGEVVTETSTGEAVVGVAVIGAEDTGPVANGPNESTAEGASDGMRATGAGVGVGGAAWDDERRFLIGWEVRSARLTQG